MTNTAFVDREEASQILKVSTRTVDRYVRKHRFKIRKEGRRVLLKRKDVDKIIQEHMSQFGSPSFSVSAVEGEGSNSKETGLQVTDIKLESIKTKANSAEEKVYRELYLETKKDLKERQDRLEAATYRVGQLEAQLKSTVPLLDYTRKEKELKEATIAIEQKMIQGKEEMMKMEQNIRSERMAKWIYLTLVGLLLVIEPLLLIWWFFS